MKIGDIVTHIWKEMPAGNIIECRPSQLGSKRESKYDYMVDMGEGPKWYNGSELKVLRAD